MKRLKSWTGLKFQRLNTAAKEQGQFDPEQIDALVPVFRDSEAMSACAWGLSLPLYAIGQLCAAGILAMEDHPALLLTQSNHKLRGASIRHLAAELRGQVRQDEMPQDCVSITIASRRIGGRLKPWASIVDALRNGGVPFWAKGKDAKIASFRIRPNDLARFQSVLDAEAPACLTIGATVSQSDAAEILNITPKYLPALAGDLGLEFERVGLGLYAPRHAVLTAAAAVAWNAEVAAYEGVDHRAVDGILAARGVSPLRTGWCRARLIKEGILPPLPYVTDAK